jgi:hypothetical protein
MNLFWYELWRSYFYIQFQSLIYIYICAAKQIETAEMNGLRWTEIRNGKPKYVNRKPKYVNRKPKYLNRKPKYLHRGRNIWRRNRNSFLNNRNSFLNNRLIVLVVVLIAINRLVARPARPASRMTWNLWKKVLHWIFWAWSIFTFLNLTLQSLWNSHQRTGWSEFNMSGKF